MKLSDEGRAFLTHEEGGCFLKSYRCPAGVWTIGVGLTGPDIGAGTVWTQAKCDARLDDHLEGIRAALARDFPAGLPQHQFDALVSLIFNIGRGGWAGSSTRALLLAGDIQGAADAILKWNKARVKGALTVLPGLVKRRERERRLFLEGVYK